MLASFNRKPPLNLALFRAFAAASLAGTAVCAQAGVTYIASSGGYVLHASGDSAVIASWGGQSPLQGFSGFGQVHLGGRCLTGKESGQPLRWEGCRVGDKAQVWSLSGGALTNDRALCADVQGGQGNNTAVITSSCNRSTGQRWRGLTVSSAASFAPQIADAAARAAFLRTAQIAVAGTFISLATGQAMPGSAMPLAGAVISAGGGNVITPSP
ncbi:hypothetical protein BH11PSE7_BH11PSE7_26170 [soil metagenome]